MSEDSNVERIANWVIDLTAERDRLRAELATAIEERDYWRTLYTGGVGELPLEDGK